jgi:hypothetical protein
MVAIRQDDNAAIVHHLYTIYSYSGVPMKEIEEWFMSKNRAYFEIPPFHGGYSSDFLFLVYTERERFIKAWSEMQIPLEWREKLLLRKIQVIMGSWTYYRRGEDIIRPIDLNTVAQLWANGWGIPFETSFDQVVMKGLLYDGLWIENMDFICTSRA